VQQDLDLKSHSVNHAHFWLLPDITTALARARWFLVIARNSSFAFKGRAIESKEVAREEMTGTVKHQAPLLLKRLCLYETHVWCTTASQIASASAASFFWRLR
jgi:hypothetical protein